MSKRSSSSSTSSTKEHEEQLEEIMYDLISNHVPNILSRALRTPSNRGVARVDRNREEGHNRLFNDYFATNPVYPAKTFRRRFRMRRSLFCRIMDKFVKSDNFFHQQRNNAGKLGLSPLQKCTAAIRQLAYRYCADGVDEYLRMGDTTPMLSLQHFAQGVISNFQQQYLRIPTEEDLRRILYQNEMRGFPGMIGSCNDLNVLYRSPVFNNVLQGRAPNARFTVNNHIYSLGYYLTDGIYPNLSTFIQGITHPQTDKQRIFSERQAHARKDVERAFGVLQARFAIVRQPGRAHDEDMLADIMKACIIIMHNMIVEDERDTYQRAEVLRHFYESNVPKRRGSTSDPSTSAAMDEEPFNFEVGRPLDINAYLGIRNAMRDANTHNTLKEDLIEHIWDKYGPNNN